MFTQPSVPVQFPAIISLSTLNGANGFVINEAFCEYSSWLVSHAGDVNNDSIADIIIAAPYYSRGDTGKAYVVFGKTGAWNSSISVNMLDGINGFAINAGSSVSAAGDLDHDGIDDILVSIHDTEDTIGKAYVVFGKERGWESFVSVNKLNGDNGFTLYGIPKSDDMTEIFVSDAGDINNDSIPDILIGLCNSVSPGKTYVVFGEARNWHNRRSRVSLNELNGTDGYQLDGTKGDKSGCAVSAAHDVNGDGIADIIIGAERAQNIHFGAGKTYIIFGKSSGWNNSISLDTLDGINGFVLSGVSIDEATGSAVNTAGDINNDGISDMIIGTNGNSGKTYVVFGKVDNWDSLISLDTLNGTNGFVLHDPYLSQAGSSVSTAGDINNLL